MTELNLSSCFFSSCLLFFRNKYAFRTEPSTDVQISLRPSKIGIFVDFENGQVRSQKHTNVFFFFPPPRHFLFMFSKQRCVSPQVSFYNVDAKIHIYTFNDVFNECVYPFFSPCTNKSGKNDGPLTITPVSRTE